VCDESVFILIQKFIVIHHRTKLVKCGDGLTSCERFDIVLDTIVTDVVYTNRFDDSAYIQCVTNIWCGETDAYCAVFVIDVRRGGHERPR